MSVVPTQSGLMALTNQVKGTVSTEAPVEQRFTARLQLLAALSDVRQKWKSEQGPKPEEGNFWCGPPGGIFLGNKFRCIPIALRDHALRIHNGEATAESFNAPPLGTMPRTPQESVYLEIKSQVKVKGKDAQGKPLPINMEGKDILCWIPPQPQADTRWPGMSVGKFAVYFLHGTAAPEADNFKAYFGKAVTVRSKQPPSKQYVWFVPEVDLGPDGGACSPDELPDMAAAADELTKFLNPIAKGEKVEAAAPEGRTR